MKKLLLMLSLLVLGTGLAHAQFEKGKWYVNTSLSGLNVNYNSSFKKVSLGLNAQGGRFVYDNLLVLANMGASWNNMTNASSPYDIYSLGAGARYYFSNWGFFTGAGLEVNRVVGNNAAAGTLLSGKIEGGYAFFLSRTVTIEPSLFLNFDKDKAIIGGCVGFSFYF